MMISTSQTEMNKILPLTASTSEEEKIATTENQENKLGQITEGYHRLFIRYTRKKLVYQKASQYFNRKEMIMFTAPLLILQVINTVLPQIPGDLNPLKMTTTLISAISAAWIAFQGKLTWGKKAERYASIASTYDMLASEAYFMMTKVSLSEKQQGGSGSISFEEKKEFRDQFIQHLEDAKKKEENARAGVGLPPSWIEESIGEKLASKQRSRDKVESGVRSSLKDM